MKLRPSRLNTANQNTGKPLFNVITPNLPIMIRAFLALFVLAALLYK